MSSLSEIPDYVLQVLARFGPLQRESDGWIFPCPCTSHSGKGIDKNPSLRVTIGDEGKVIVYCRTGCSTQDVLASVNLSFVDLYCPAGEEPASALLFNNSEQQAGPKPMELWHEVYSEVIRLSVLHDSHAEDLEKRGIDLALAQGLQYRSLLTTYDESLLLNKLNKKFGIRLLEVPGFRPCKEIEGFCQFAINPKGMLIPIRDLNGNIMGMKTRRPFAPKYIIWSTREGASAGTPVHCPLTPPTNTTTVRITEGEIKADLAWRRSGVYTISIPGVGAWLSALPVLENLTVRKALLSFDYPDVINKNGVARLLRLFAETLISKGYEIGFETWDTADSTKKGIDDVLVAGMTPIVYWGEEAITKIREAHSGEAIPINFFDPGEPEPFPMEVFPPILREFINQHSQSIQCPEDFMATAMLAVAARCLGTARSIQLDSKWTELANQYYCIVAPPSSGKSPAAKRVLSPIRRMQKEDANRYENEMAAFAADMSSWREEVKQARRAGTELPDSPSRPRPIMHYWVSDITVETVAKRLHDNGHNTRNDPSMLYFRDEILAWIKSLNQYRGGKGGDKEFFLSTWSNEDVKVDRKTDNETLIISCPALTVLGGIQPDLLSELTNDCGKDDGFFARLLFSFPNTMLGFDPVSSFNPDNDLEEAWETVSRRLLALCPIESPNQNPDSITKLYQPKTIPLSPEAREVWNNWHQQENVIIRNPNFPPQYISAWGKHRAILARFALVMHYLHGASMPVADYDIDQPITAPAMQCAIKVLDYFRSHYQRVLKRINFTPHERKVENFIKHVLAHHSGTISYRDIYRQRLFECKGREDAEILCKLAVDRGFGMIEKISSTLGGKPSFMFIVQNS